MKNTDKYRVTVENRQTADNMTDTVTESGTGSYRKSGDTCYITYDTGAAKVFIKASPESVRITRKGDSSAETLYRPEKRAYFEYKTAYGSIAMSVFTKAIEIDAAEDGGSIRLRYSLNAGDEDMQNDVKINWEVTTQSVAGSHSDNRHRR